MPSRRAHGQSALKLTTHFFCISARQNRDKTKRAGCADNRRDLVDEHAAAGLEYPPTYVSAPTESSDANAASSMTRSAL